MFPSTDTATSSLFTLHILVLTGQAFRIGIVDYARGHMLQKQIYAASCLGA